MQSRLKSKVLWVSLAALFLSLLGDFGLYETLGIKQDLLQKAIDFIIYVLASFGILNNPTDKENF